MAMEATHTETLFLESQSILWWPWTTEEYQSTAMRFNELAEREGTTVEVVPFRTPHMGFFSLLPNVSGLYIRVWAVNNAAASDNHVDSPQEDILSGFRTRLCDDRDQHEEEEVCCICLDDLYRGSVTTLECGHEFHPDCIRRWLVRGQNFCPLCKAPAIR